MSARLTANELTLAEYEAAVRLTWSEDELLTDTIQRAQGHGFRVAHFRPAKTAKGWRTAVQGDGLGFPDLVMLRDGRCVVVELKAKGAKVKRGGPQDAWLCAFRDAALIEVFEWNERTPVEDIEAMLR